MSEPSTPSSEEDLQVPMPRVATFVRQLSHDLRNHLNAAELQSAYLGEIADNAELKDEVKRLRAMLGEMGESLQRLTNSIAAINLTVMPYEAADFMEDLRAKVGTQFPEQSGEIEWKIETGNALLEIDPQILQPAFQELFENAFRHERGAGPLRVAAQVGGGEFTFTLTEPKTTFSGETEHWGRQPLARVKHGHYGLGLPRVRSIIEAHHGQLRAHFEAGASSLITTLVLPLAGDA